MLANLLGNTVQSVRWQQASEDFVPYACHLDDCTLLTKNGEVLQVIKIPALGVTEEAVMGGDVRAAIRQAIADNIPQEEAAIWFHTLRQPISFDTRIPSAPHFSRSLHRAYSANWGWVQSHANEIYITIIFPAATARLTQPGLVVASFSKWWVERHYLHHVDKTVEKLNLVTAIFCAALAKFNATILGVEDMGGVLYSAPLSFLRGLITGEYSPMPMEMADSSHLLSRQSMAVGYNAIELIGNFGKRFLAMFTIKDYYELQPITLDLLLGLDFPLVITQTFLKKKLLAREENLHRQYDLLVSSGDEEFSVASGIEGRAHRSSRELAASQITVSIYASDPQKLESRVKELVASASEVGILLARFDIELEDVYWSQLPANFSFLRRQYPVAINFVPGFTIRHSYPMGFGSGKGWATPLVTLNTSLDTPYFYSFFSDNSFHVSLMGNGGIFYYQWLHFLVAEAQKIAVHTTFLSSTGRSWLPVRALAGRVVCFTPQGAFLNGKPLFLNPLSLKDTPVLQHFIRQWIVALVASSGEALSEREQRVLHQIVDQVLSLNLDQRRLHVVKKYLLQDPLGKNLAERLSPWCEGGIFGALFDSGSDQWLPMREAVQMIDFSAVMTFPALHGVLLLYSLHALHSRGEGAGLVVLEDAWELMDHPFVSPLVDGWLKFMQQSGNSVLWAGNDGALMKKRSWAQAVKKQFGSNWFVVDQEINEIIDFYQGFWDLQKNECTLLQECALWKDACFLRQHGLSLQFKTELSAIREAQILSGSFEVATLADSLIADRGEDPDAWLPILYQHLDGRA
jgi:type IV secretion system protein VirB4